MPLPVPAPETALLRFALVVAGVRASARPGASQDLKITREPGDSNVAGSFYYRDKLSGGPFTFTGYDFKLLYGIETSRDRCQPIGLLVEHRAYPGADWEQWRGEFTCNDCENWSPATCSVDLSPMAADPYAKLLDNWEKEFNILLAAPGLVRKSVSAQLATLAAGTEIEFKRIDQAELSDYVGTDEWALFYTNESYIYKDRVVGFLGAFQKNTDAVIFRYRQRAVATLPGGQPLDRNSTGWVALVADPSYQPALGVVDYVKSPSIAGFRAYKLTGNGSTTPFLRTSQPGNPEAGLYTYGSGQFLSLDCGLYQKPSDVGLDNTDWVKVTGPDGYGANNREACDGTGILVREEIDDENYRALFWRFGNFTFGRAFRFIDGLYSLLSQTVAPYGGLSLLPPTPEQLSEFLTAATNPATGDSGAENEIPRLLLSAGSDIKRFGSSEAATRLLISLKQFLGDSGALWDAGWFIDPATGWLRFEHRAYLETKQGAGAVVDLRELEEVLLSNSYSYRVQSLPRYEDLQISNASTEDIRNEAYFAKASIDYGPGACVTSKEGSNRVSMTSARLTGDVAAGILNGDSIPDNALFVLAPDEAGRLPNANRELSASYLLLRYYRRGRAADTATVEGPAPLTAPNTVTGALPQTGPPLLIQSVRPQRVQASISGKLGQLRTLAADARYTSNLGEAAQLGKAELTLRTRKVVVTIWLTVPFSNTAAPVPSRQFDDSFDQSFG